MERQQSRLFMKYCPFIQIIICFVCCSIAGAQPIPDILYQLKNATHDSTRIRLYTKLAKLYAYQNKSDSSLFFIKDGFALANSFPQYKSELYMYWGLCYRAHNAYDKAISKFNIAEKFAIKFRQKPIIERIGFCLAITYTDKGDFSKAIKQTFKNIKTAKKFKSSKRLCENYALLGAFNDYCDNDSLALFYHRKAFEIKLNKEDSIGFDDTKALLRLELYAKKISIALKYKQYEYANQLFKANFSSIIPYDIYIREYYDIVIDIAFSYYKYGFKKKSLVIIENILKSDTIHQPEFNDILHGSVYPILTRLYLDQNKITLANKFHNKSVPLIRRYANIKQYLMVSENKAILLEKQGNYRQALNNFHIYNALQDSITNQTNELKALQLTIIAESEKQESDLELANQQIRVQELKLETGKRKQVYTDLTITLLALGIGITIIFLQQLRNGHRTALRQKSKIEKQAIELHESNQIKDKLFSIISHDLRSPVAELQSALTLFGTENNLDIKKTRQQMYNRVTNLRETLDNLLYWSASQINQIHLTEKKLNLRECVQECISFLEPIAIRKNITILDQVDDYFVRANDQQIQIVLRNVLSNAIKFTPAEGYIRISSVKSVTYTGLVIRDTGIGMPEQTLKTIFSTPHLQQSTTGEKGIGLGLRLCKELMAKMGGELTIDSHPNSGTSVYLSFKQEEPTYNKPVL